jgi:hypothetical protein
MPRNFFPVKRPRATGSLLGFFLLVLAVSGSPATAQSQADEAVVRFAVIGDSGTGKKEQYEIGRQMARWHERLPFPTVLMLGDNIYGGLFGWGGGNKKDFPKKFDKPYAELLERGIWFRASLGNHDTKKDNGRHLLADWDRFHIEGENGYYSFTVGESNGGAPLVEFFALNTVRFDRGRTDPGQLAWLEQALQNSRARWRIVYGHHTMYSTGKKHGADKRLRGMVEPILLGQEPNTSGAKAPESLAAENVAAEATTPWERATEKGGPRVQVVLGGHEHFYQRFHPQHGIVYFVDGSSGKLRRGNAKPDPTVAVLEDQLHVFMLWEVMAEELRFRAINIRGEAFDCGVIRAGGKVEEVACSDWVSLTNAGGDR